MLPYVTSEEPRWSPMLRFLDQPGREVFANLPGNMSIGRTEPYVCIAPVRNFYLLSEQRAAELAERWVLDTIPPNIVDDLAAGRCLLLLDLSNEGAPYVEDVFDSIHSWAGQRSVPASSIVLVTQNRTLEAAEVARHGNESIGLLCYDYFVLAMAELFALDDDVFEETAGFPPAEITAAVDRAKERMFLCLNATARPHRVAFVGLLRDLGIQPDVLLSFHGNRGGGKPGAQDLREVHDLLQRLDALSLLGAAQDVLEAEPVYADTVDKRGNELYDVMSLEAYASTAISLVTETDFTDGAMVRITEKTVKALCLGHPVIVVGNPRSLQLARELGFETFDPFLDERYDTMADPSERFALIRAELSRLTTAPRGSPLRLAPELREICHHNARHARGGLLTTYRAAIESPFVTEVTRRLDRLERL